MALTQLNQLAIAFKKLSGKTHTNSNFGANNESVGSAIQLGTSTIFGESITASPNTTLFSTSSGVEKIAFELSPIDLSIYTVKTGSLAANTSSSIGNQGDGAPTLGIFSNGHHAYALKITSSYQANSNNPKKGTTPFINGYHVSGSNGTLQLIPEQYGPSYIATVKSGSETIALGNEVDYYLDYYSGILFVQDYSATTIPTTVEAYIYVGKYANEVIASGSGGSGNGFPFSGSAEITGSLTVSGSGITVDGGNITLTSSSITSVSSSINFTTGSITINNGSITAPSFIGTASWAQSASNAVNSQTASFLPVATYNITASWANNAVSASYALNATNAQTASYVNILNQNVTINGTLTAYTGSFNVLQVNYISSSIIYSSGSNTFGDELSDTQTLSGSVYIVGPNFTWNGNTVITSADTGSMTVSSASYASTASFVQNAQTASYVLNAISSSFASTASFVQTAQTASYVLNAVSSSFASTASFVQNAQTASFVQTAQTASFVLNAVSSSFASTASFVQNAQTASYVLNAISSSFASTASFVQTAQTASYVETAQTASYVLNAVSSSFASTASFVQTAQTASYVLNAVSSSFASTASFVQTAQTASYVLNAISSSFASTASFVQNAQTASFVLNAVSASYVLNAVSASYVLNAVSSSFASTASFVNTLNQDVTINGQLTANAGTSSFNNITIANNAIVNGDFFVYGSSSFINVNNLAIEDKFILLNSGSTGAVPNEGGIIVQTTSSAGGAAGAALFYDQTANRWMVARSSSVVFNDTSITIGATTDFIVTVSASNGAPTGTPVNFGTGDSAYSVGQMYIQTDGDRDIYIYA